MRFVDERNFKESRRRAVRRAVSVECEVSSDQWEGAVSLPVTDLSAYGLWLQTLLTLHAGEEVLVSFAPPFWPNRSPLVALAAVSRVGMFRRRDDLHESGMGLVFTDINTDEARMLANLLRGLPPPLRATRQIAEQKPHPAKNKRPYETPFLLLEEGEVVRFRAEHRLLTGDRREARLSARASRSRKAVAAGAYPRFSYYCRRFAA
ncbi:MAG: PilZ domain-containing protein [Deltaproteobacteria bacterium]|nr:PilZ domain-containing protein [Deltaproteobacteria bacterium]